LEFELLAPRLHQIFYIGDGLTGTNIGQRQEFVVPDGATRLFLGTSDGFGWFNNSGSFEVTICRLTEIVEGSELVPTKIRFDQELYTVETGAPIAGEIIMEPVPASGLYSQGLLIEVRDREGSFAGVVSPAPADDLDFDGVLDEMAAAVESGDGTGGVKGSARFSTRFSTGLPLLFDSVIAGFRIKSLPAGTYDLTLRAWNKLGPTEDIFVTGRSETLDPVITFGAAVAEVEGTSLPESIEFGTITLNRQTGLLEQTVTVTNDTGQTLDGFRLFIRDLPEDVQVWNAHGTVDGVPYFDISGPIAPDALPFDVIVEYYRPSRDTAFNPSFEIAEPGAAFTRPEDAVAVNLDLRVVALSTEGLILEFLTEAETIYTVEYSDDMQTWSVAQPQITGTGQRIQWIDSGPPKTNTPPGGARFYRVFKQDSPQP